MQAESEAPAATMWVSSKGKCYLYR